MKFLSLISSSLFFHHVVFISFVAFSHLSFCLSPPNSRFSLEDQFSPEDLLDDEGSSTDGTTTLISISSEETVTSNSTSIECECGIRGEPEQSLSIPEILSDVVNAHHFVLNGTEGFRGELPWLAAISRHSDFFAPRVICGASLISSKFLLTAAHCINNHRKERLRVIFNAWKISPFFDVRKDKKAMILKVKRLIPHPKYNHETVDNDIGLIELEQPIDFLRTKDAAVRPVCLPSTKENDYAGINATVAGWGYTSAYGGLNSPTIQKATVPILSHDNCRKTQLGSQILPGMLCAGLNNGGIDACTNDSGGPLVVEEGRSNILVGVVSWGYSCGLPKLPGVYARVTNYLDWIDQQIKSDGNRCVKT